MEERTVFGKADLTYLANLCHNCGECLYSCQYAPPHEFGINVPRTLAEIRLASYEEYCWPKVLGTAFRRHNLFTGMALAVLFNAVLLAPTWMVNRDALTRAEQRRLRDRSGHQDQRGAQGGALVHGARPLADQYIGRPRVDQRLRRRDDVPDPHPSGQLGGHVSREQAAGTLL